MADQKPQNPFRFDISDTKEGERPPQEYYDEIKAKFAEERDLRLGYRPPGTTQYVPLEGELAHYETDPHATEHIEREPIDDEVEVLFIGGGFSALLTSARLREKGVESIRIVERGADVGGPGTGIAIPASPVMSSPTTTCRCSTRWSTCRPATTPRGLRSSPTVRRLPASTTSTILRSSRPR
ncbi:MAG: FAD/NAD(P)-binding protein [Acidimicrobiales bacterium]